MLGIHRPCRDGSRGQVSWEMRCWPSSKCRGLGKGGLASPAESGLIHWGTEFRSIEEAPPVLGSKAYNLCPSPVPAA